MVDVAQGGAVLEKDGSAVNINVRDGRSSLDLGVLEGLVAKVDVVFAAHDGVDGRFGDVDQADGCVGGGDGCADCDDSLGVRQLRMFKKKDFKQGYNTFPRYFSGSLNPFVCSTLPG